MPPAGHPVLNGWGLMECTDTDGASRPCLIRQLAEGDELHFVMNECSNVDKLRAAKVRIEWSVTM